MPEVRWAGLRTGDGKIHRRSRKTAVVHGMPVPTWVLEFWTPLVYLQR